MSDEEEIDENLKEALDAAAQTLIDHYPMLIGYEMMPETLNRADEGGVGEAFGVHFLIATAKMSRDRDMAYVGEVATCYSTFWVEREGLEELHSSIGGVLKAMDEKDTSG